MSGPQAPGLPKKAYPGPPETPPLPPPQLPSPQPPRAWWQDPHPDPALGSSIRMRGTLGACGLTSIKSSGWHWALPDGAPRMTGDKALVPTEQGGPATGHTHGRLQVSFLGLLAWACRRLCQPPTRAPHPSLCQAQYPHPPTHHHPPPPTLTRSLTPAHSAPHTHRQAVWLLEAAGRCPRCCPCSWAASEGTLGDFCLLRNKLLGSLAQW